MALNAYRHLLRATRIAFQGDQPVLAAARTQAREGFDRLRALNADSEDALKGIEHAEGVAEVLLKNVVQGKAKHGDTSTMRLRIHEHTERGDNDTVKNPNAPGGKVKIGGL